MTSLNSPSSFSSFLTLLCLCASAQASTISVAANPNPSRYGQPVTLSALVSPSSATGKVTFYDGPRVLGIAPLSGGTAALTSTQLASGVNSITARYDGDGGNAPALSLAFGATVNAVAGNGFPRLVSYATGQNPNGIASGDFNGDGKLDLAVTSGVSQQVFVLLGNGDGTFRTPVAYGAGPVPVAIAVADMNGDGKPDLIVANDQGPASINILLGNGDGTFQPLISYATPDAPFALVAGDFNGDGAIDIAVANDQSYSEVSIFLGRGDGTLMTPVDISTTEITGAVSLTLGDFNRDGITDIAVGGSKILILLGHGDGTFAEGQVYVGGTDINDVKTADFNGDGKLDLVTVDYASAAVNVLLGNGDGTFQPAAGYAVQNAPSSVLVADFNGDGIPDIIAANYFQGAAGTVSVLAGNGDGTFRPAANFPAGIGPFRLAQGDFNADGIVDLAVADLGTFGGNVGGTGILLGGCIAVTPTTPLAYDNRGGTAMFTLTASNPACTWTASSTVPGVILQPPSGTGTGSGSITVTATTPANNSSADLNGIIQIAGTTIPLFEAFTTQQFTDVPPTAYYFDSANLLKTHNITAGCGPTTYCPAEIVTRDQMAIFIVRSIYGGDNFPVNLQTPYFTDVTPTTFGYMWIQKMHELQITAGCAPNLYCPTQQVTRDQMAIFIIRARYGATTVFTSNPSPLFADVPTNYFAFPWIQRMKEDNITAGCAPTLYCPGNPVTRGDMSLFVDRGAFNLLLPSTEAVISQVTPATLAPGTSNVFTVTGVNTHFTQGTPVVVATGGLTASGVTVSSDTQFTVTLTADPGALIQPEPMYVQSSVEAVLPNAISVHP